MNCTTLGDPGLGFLICERVNPRAMLVVLGK